MGLFSKKEICSICNQNEAAKKLADGAICKNCMSKCSFQSALKTKTVDTIKQSIIEDAKNEKLKSMFTATKKIEKYFEVDEKNQLWRAPRIYSSTIFSYKDILNFELLENGEAITKGGLGNAIVGGALLGGVGAIVGGVVGPKKTKQEITEYRIKIVVKNFYFSEVYINFLETGKVKSGSFLYKTYAASAQQILSMLAIMTDSIKNPEPIKNPDTANNYVADEIIKFKSLLDQGIITQEEFDAKKKQLLGL